MIQQIALFLVGFLTFVGGSGVNFVLPPKETDCLYLPKMKGDKINVFIMVSETIFLINSKFCNFEKK